MQPIANGRWLQLLLRPCAIRRRGKRPGTYEQPGGFLARSARLTCPAPPCSFAGIRDVQEKADLICLPAHALQRPGAACRKSRKSPRRRTSIRPRGLSSHAVHRRHRKRRLKPIPACRQATRPPTSPTQDARLKSRLLPFEPEKPVGRSRGRKREILEPREPASPKRSARTPM